MKGDMGRSRSTPRTSWKMQRVQFEDRKRQQHFGDLHIDGSVLLSCNLLPLTQSIVHTLTLIYKLMNATTESSVQCKAMWISDFRLLPWSRWELPSSGSSKRVVVIPYRRFGTTYRSHIQGWRVFWVIARCLISQKCAVLIQMQ